MKHAFNTAAALAAVFLLPGSVTAAELQVAQVQVIESSPIRPIGQPRANANGNNAAPTTTDSATNIQAELFYQLQILQQEVQTLRGMVEEQAYQIQQLKQQRMDDYMDLDRRISELGQTSSRPAASRPGSGGPATASPGNQAPAPVDNEFDSYSAAVDIATKQQDFERAIIALNEHLKRFPDGRYTANAYYWLGQIFFVQGKMEEAQQAFSRVVDAYPDHNKAPEARYKLGQVYFRLGDKAQAKALLEEVARGNSDSAPLARNFLQQNFP